MFGCQLALGSQLQNCKKYCLKPFFFTFLFKSTFKTKKVTKKYFNQLLGAQAVESWSKYTTHIIYMFQNIIFNLLVLSEYLNLERFLFTFEYWIHDFILSVSIF